MLVLVKESLKIRVRRGRSRLLLLLVAGGAGKLLLVAALVVGANPVELLLVAQVLLVGRRIVALRIPEPAAVVGVGELRDLEHGKDVDGGDPLKRIGVPDNERAQLVEAGRGQLLEARARQVATDTTVSVLEAFTKE